MKILLYSQAILILLVFSVFQSFCQNGYWSPEPIRFKEYIIDHAVETIGENIYIMGGFIRAESSIESARGNKVVWSYNINTREWKRLFFESFRPRGQIASLTYKNNIYLLGGANKYDGYYQDHCIDEFNPAAGAWNEIDSVPADRMGSTACIIDDKLYLIGGAQVFGTKFTTMKFFEIYDFDSDIEDKLDSKNWIKPNNLPIPLAYATAIPVDKDIYVLGGDTKIWKAPEPVFLKYDTETSRWNTELSIPSFTGSVGACKVGQYFYVFGGRSFTPFEDQGEYKGSDEVFMYDIKQDFWLKVAKMPFGLWTVKVKEIDGRIYVVGGKHCHDLEIEKKAGYFPSIYTYTPVTAPIYSKKTTVSKYSLLSVNDSCLVKAQIIHKYDYNFIVSAEFKGEVTSELFETQLYDDGQHEDGEKDDGLYAGYFKHPGIEDLFDIHIVSHNLNLDENFFSGQDCRSICTIGPIVVDGCEITRKEINSKGETIAYFTIDLKNTGKKNQATNLSIELFSKLDKIRLTDKNSYYNTIKPGEKAKSISEFSMMVSPSSELKTAIINASISLDGISYWNQKFEIRLDL